MRARSWLHAAAVVGGAAALAALSWETRAGTAGNQSYDHVYVTSPTDGIVAVVDRATMERVGTVFTGGQPRGIAVLADGTCAFVANTATSRLEVIDTATQSVEDSIRLVGGEGSPWDVAITPDGAKAYVTHSGGGDVSVVNLVTHTETKTISLPFLESFPPRAEGIAMAPDGSRAFVVDAAGAQVFAIDTAADEIVADWVVNASFGAKEVAVSGDGERGIVVGGGPPVFFSTRTGNVVSSSLDPLGDQVDVSVDGDLAYVTNRIFGPPVKDKGPRVSPTFGSTSIDVYRFSSASYLTSQAIRSGLRPEGIAAENENDIYVCLTGFENAGTLLDYDIDADADGGSAPTGTEPWRAAVVRVEGGTQVVSFFLPTVVNMTLAKAGTGKDSLVTGGLFDDGNLPADYEEPVTVEVGSFSRTFTLARKGSVYSFRDGVIDFRITPNLRGSSRGRFTLRIQKTTLAGLVSPDGPVEIRFVASGLPNAAGTVVLEKGRYRRAKKRGALVAPPFFAGLGQFTLKGENQDSCIVRWGFSGGATPATLADVRIGIGALDLTVPGASFRRDPRKTEELFTATVTEGSRKVTISLDYKRELARVVAKGVELGPLAGGVATDFRLDAGNGAGVFTNRVRLGSLGKKIFY